MRNHDLRTETRTHIVILIGEVDDKQVVDDDTDLKDGEERFEKRDKSPRDRIEEIALGVIAPGPSMNSASRNVVMLNPFCLKSYCLMRSRHQLSELK